MSRAILLPTLSDPYLLSAWVKLYKNVFKSETDKLYVLIAADAEPGILDYCANLFRGVDAEVFVEPQGIDHGDAIRYLLERCQEDTVCLLEDDLFVLKPGFIDEAFKMVESGTFDVVGSTRGCASQEIIDAEVRSFSLTGKSPEHSVAQCPHLWPCLLFTKKEHLLNTDRNFNAKSWPAGTFIKEINHTCQEFCASDTFVWATIQLRAAGHRFGYIHQRHAGDVDRADSIRGTGLFANGGAPWVHFGSLSSGFNGHNLLLHIEGDKKYPISRYYKKTEGDYIPLDQNTANVEIARRVSLWKLFSQYNQIQDPTLSGYNGLYAQAVTNCISRYNMHQAIGEFERAYFKLLNRIFI